MAGAQQPFATFTREFRHPEDLVPQVTPQAASRFFYDDRRFPPFAYEEASLLWRGNQWRVPSPDERSQMLGIPQSATAAVASRATARVRDRNSLLGNGFHLPSVVALLVMLPQLCANKLTVVSPACGSQLKARLEGSLWQPGRLEVYPGLLGAAETVEIMRSQFPDITVPLSTWTEVLKRLQRCDIRLPQAFVAFQRSRGEQWDSLGPRPMLARDRAEVFAGNTGQRYPSDSSKGLDFLLQPGLGKLEHIRQALSLPSPFQPRQWPEPDVAFVLHSLNLWREAFPLLAARQRDVLSSLKRAVKPLLSALTPFRCAAARAVASQKDPAFLSLMVALLRWPDVTQAQAFVLGFPIVGDIGPSGVFRFVRADPSKAESVEDWLVRDAGFAVDRLLQSGPPRNHDVILTTTLKEIDQGFCSPLLDRAEVDQRFGRGRWRPLERFALPQSDKTRIIDNARKTEHNHHTRLSETIHTVNVDFIACVCRDAIQVCHITFQGYSASEPWFLPRVGTDDLPDAYRGHPVRDDHLRFSVVAVWVPQLGWRFSVMFGLAYGLESAVVAFNRFPLLGISVARRCASSLCAAYFDDELSLELVANSDVSQTGVRFVFHAAGADPKPTKSFAPCANRFYLGTSVHLGLVSQGGPVVVQPKASTVTKVLNRLDEVIQQEMLSREAAAKLRGDLQWMFSSCTGYGSKYASPLLSHFQATDCPDLNSDHVLVLSALRAQVENAEPREVLVNGTKSPCLIVYSDASFEQGELRLGWVLFPGPWRTLGGTCLVPQAVLDSWADRRQQIYPGETLAVLAVPMLYADLFQNRDVLWFLDNQASLATALTGASTQDDVHELSHLAAVCRVRTSTRMWFDWIDSESNPSDGLSRLGLSCTWTAAQDWTLQEFQFPRSAYRDRVRSALLKSEEQWDLGSRNFGVLSVF